MVVRYWQPEDNLEFIRWVHRDPSMMDMMGFKDGVLDGDIDLFLTNRLFDQRSIQMAIETEDGDLAGFGSVDNVNPDGSAFCHIAVAPEHRGKGVWVAKAAMRAMKQYGIKTLIAMVLPDNKLSARFQKLLGFKPPEADILVFDLANTEV